ncbi:DsbA family protein [Rhodobacteraceae bacterium]|nr:DsbA family protein [Paracoccaceae bacterium]
MIRKLTVLASLATVAVLGMFALAQLQGTNTLMGAAHAQSAEDIDTSGIIDMSIGNPDAKVTIIEYASFTCPHCAAFHADSFKKLKADFIDTGLINFVNREIYFDRFGLWAGITARCGENAENRYFGIIDMIYAQQRDWANSNNPPEVIVEKLRTIGKTAGLTDADLDACFQDGDKAQALYATYVKNSEADGVRATPSFVINGEMHSNMAYDDLKALIESML